MNALADPQVPLPGPVPGELAPRVTAVRTGRRSGIRDLDPGVWFVAGDLAATGVAAGVAMLLTAAPAGALALLGLGWLGMLAAHGAYRRPATDPTPPLAPALRAALLWAAAGVLVTWVGGLEMARPALLLVVGATVAATVGVRSLLALMPFARPRVLVVGDQEQVRGLLDSLQARARPVWDVPGLGVTDGDPPDLAGVPAHQVADPESIAALAEDARVDAVVLVPGPDLTGPALRRLSWLLEPHRTRLVVMPGLQAVAGFRASLTATAQAPLVHLRPSETHSARRRVQHALGRCAAALLILLAAPVLLAVALAVRLDSPGPVLYRQTRIGRDGMSFRMIKFRTMEPDADQHQPDALNQADQVLFKIRQDPRLTRIGGFLRRYSLDELPQLLNVVRGEMALVGPRPALPQEVARYQPEAHRRLAVRPGITGLWQVSGRSDLSWAETLRLDLSYVDNWSPMLDVRILCRTVTAVLSHRGAY